ncbi:MAG: hypothetical protein JO244_10490 [Solirubrobacterales bacterium]|nr:hypothetical protein [Solirubrobacterales bacterium]
MLEKVPRRWLVVTGCAAAFLLGPGAQAALAEPYLPPAGKVFQGVAGQPPGSYQTATGKHPAVYQEFLAWGQWVPGITAVAANAHARLMLMISTRSGSQEMINPAQIAAGQGDAWLISLQNSVASSGLVTYVRLMAEMDGYWNPYSAYNQDGSWRGPAHSSAAYKQAWRRVTLIFRGGSLAAIDAELHHLGMPPLRTTRDLPVARVAMLWVPQVAPGDPDVPGNQPSSYWPGRAWVDWVGTDFYSFAPNFSGLSAFYDSYPGMPFVFGEYAVGETGDDPGFINQLFGWVGAHPRVRMMIYNQGVNPVGPFGLYRFPQTRGALRHVLRGPKFPAFAPEFQP